MGQGLVRRIRGQSTRGPTVLTWGSDLLFSVALCAETTEARRRIMKRKITRAAGLGVAFVAGMVVATVLGGGITAGQSQAPAAAAPQQQVTVQKVITPTVTDEDIVLLRKDLRAMKMQVIGQNMSLSDEQAQKFWPVYNHYVK